MVSPEIFDHYPFFEGLDSDQIGIFTISAQELIFEKNYYIFKEGEELNNLYFVLEGQACILLMLPKKDVIITTFERGDVFGWSALVPPKTATSSAKALTTCRLITFNGQVLREYFEKDYKFGYIMMQRIAYIIRTRLEYSRVVTLALSS